MTRIKGAFKVSGLGEKLRQKRIEMGLTLQEVEEQTKIRILYLEAIEAENYKSLPGKVYITGFLRSYCKLLKIDPNEIINEFNADWSAKELDTDDVMTYVQEAPIREKRSPKINFNYNKIVRFSIIVLAVVVLLVVNQLWDRSTPSLPPPQDPSVVNNVYGEEGNGETAGGPNAGQEPVYTGVNIEIIPVRDSCWLEVTIGNQVVFVGVLGQGEESLVFNDENEIRVRFGNAGAVDVVYNGELLEPIGNIGEVVTRTFTVELED